jgi:hypothetical protein
MNITYDYIGYIDERRAEFHLLNLRIDDTYYGNRIIPVTSDLGQLLNEYIDTNSIVIPIEESAFPDDSELPDNALFDLCKINTQMVIDGKAKELNYDNAVAISTYYNSTVDKFRNEARRFIAWRDQCWLVCNGIIDQYKNGEIPRPTVNGVIESLPILNWNETEETE